MQFNVFPLNHNHLWKKVIRFSGIGLRMSIVKYTLKIYLRKSTNRFIIQSMYQFSIKYFELMFELSPYYAFTIN